MHATLSQSLIANYTLPRRPSRSVTFTLTLSLRLCLDSTRPLGNDLDGTSIDAGGGLVHSDPPSQS